MLLDDNFASIVSGIEEGRAVFANIRKFLTYVLTHNVAELVPFLAFALVRIESVLRTGLLGNRWIAAGVALGLALLALIAYTPWGNAAIGTAPLPIDAWLVMLPFAAALLLFEELRKLWVRRHVLATHHGDVG